MSNEDAWKAAIESSGTLWTGVVVSENAYTSGRLAPSTTGEGEFTEWEFHKGDVIEFIGDFSIDAEGNEWRLTKNSYPTIHAGTTVQLWVATSYKGIPIVKEVYPPETWVIVDGSLQLENEITGEIVTLEFPAGTKLTIK